VVVEIVGLLFAEFVVVVVFVVFVGVVLVLVVLLGVCVGVVVCLRQHKEQEGVGV